MRVTNRSKTIQLLRDLRANLNSLSAAQREAVTGKRIHTVSDEPMAAGRIMGIDRGLRAAEQFRANGTASRVHLAVQDDVLTSVRDILDRARNLAVGTRSDNLADPGRQAALAEAQLLFEHVVALGNTTVGDDFIFGGTETATDPFQPNGAYVGNSDLRRAEVDSGLLVQVNDPGDALLGTTIQALQDLILELQTGTAAAVQGTAAALNTADTEVLTSQSVTGARLQQLDQVDSQIAARVGTQLDAKDDIDSVEPAEALLKVANMQAAIERAYAVTGRVLESSLLDFLR